MAHFPLHTPLTAPAASQPVLSELQTSLGFIPSLYAQIAEAPGLLSAYTTLEDIFEETGFSPTEQQLILLTISVEHESHYCTPAHARLAAETGLSRHVVDTIRTGGRLSDPRLDSLHRFVRRMVQQRGFLSDTDIHAFIDAGFTRANVLEVVLAIGLKTLSNYVNHLAETPPDALTQPMADEPVIFTPSQPEALS